MKIRCLVIDDEKPARAEMCALLSVIPRVEVAGEAANVATALEICRKTRPDVVFLDVQLRGETGFDFLGQLEDPLPRIVFVTAHDAYAVRAFECNALDYLLKPVHPDRLAETLKRLPSPPVEPPRALPEDMVLVKTKGSARFVPWGEIHSVEAEGNYTRLFLAEGSSSLVLRPLKEWMKLAPDHHFLQVHRSALVFRKAIRETRITADERRELVLKNGRVMPVGRVFWRDLKAALT